MKRRIKIYLKSGARIYCLLVLLLAIFQRRMIYQPERGNEVQFLAQAQASNLEPWRDAAGGIIGWKRPPNKGHAAANRLVVFHGNAGSAQDRDYYIDAFEQLADGALWEVRVFEYPGYGARLGSPGEAVFIRAAREAVQQLAREDARPIHVLGESLGSGVACALARDEPEKIAGVFLVTPFARLRDVAQRRFPIVPIRLFLRDPWDNIAALKDFRGPVAVLIAGKDDIVSAPQGEKLFAAYAGPKRRWLDPAARHNTVQLCTEAPWWPEVSDFLLRR